MKKSSKRIIFIIFSITLIAIFLSLGLWQLKRKIYKDELIIQINNQIALPEIKYQDSEKKILYRNMIFTGNFEDDIKLFIYGSNNENEKNGYFVLMPFRLDSGDLILVVRGWVQNIKDQIEFETKNQIAGLVIKSDRESNFTPEADLKNKVFYSFNIQKISKLLKVKLKDFILIEKFSNSKVNLDKFIIIYNKHIEYIITWFTLALFTSIILIFNRKNI
jgi:surfeit locus 1 family protein